jgi:hypothetical protein
MLTTAAVVNTNNAVTDKRGEQNLRIMISICASQSKFGMLLVIQAGQLTVRQAKVGDS